MSRMIETEVFKFDELSKEAQQTAIEKLFDLNVDHDWWNSVYEDADRIGLKITSFGLDRGTIEGEFTGDLEEVCRDISKEHGEKCETYQTAANYLESHNKAMTTHKKEDPGGFPFEDTHECDNIEAEFLCDLLEDYRVILQKEYDYLTSEEAIKETIEANNYEFTADGEMY